MKRISDSLLCLALASAVLLPACGGGSSNLVQNTTTTPTPPANVTIPSLKLATDTFANTASQHATIVEPGAFAVNRTIVSAFQVGRVFSGGAAAIGYATSIDGGTTWSSGTLPGITTIQGGTYSAVSDPAVAFDAKHNVWLASTLGVGITLQVLISRSFDGFAWSSSALVSTTPSSDKNWITCDNTPTSPFFGNCYHEWDDPDNRTFPQLVWMSTSSDGGVTWSAPKNTANALRALGGVPLVLPSGRVVAPILSTTGAGMVSFFSDDGGATWNPSLQISSVTDHQVAGSLRTISLPSSAIDGGGRIYVVWQDCRFRSGCTSNDIVMSTTIDGQFWSSPVRIPIDANTSGVDHFIPAIGADPATSGATARLTLSYYFYPTAACTASTCQMSVGIVTSSDGGATWSLPATVAGPMLVSSLPDTFSGRMVGDYTATVYSAGRAISIFAVAKLNVGTTFDQAMYAVITPSAVAGAATLRADPNERPQTFESDHPLPRFYDLEHRVPVRPPGDPD